jgi:hypothetical protein
MSLKNEERESEREKRKRVVILNDDYLTKLLGNEILSLVWENVS